jgi:hypothetical protein
MLGFLVMFVVIRQINYALVVAVERRNERIGVISLSQVSRQLFKLYC